MTPTSAPPTSAPPEPDTLATAVRLRAERDGARPFVTFLADGDRDERRLTYGQLEARALAVAGALSARGLVPGDRVLIMLPSGLDFIEAFVGVTLAGMVAVPVYPPARLARLEHYLRTLAAITDTASCRAVVVDDRLVPLVGKHLTFKGQALITDRELRGATAPGRPHPLEPGSPAFLQFTSGTTSQPRGVLLLHGQVQAQLRAYCEALRVGAGEAIISWLPLYHDLGLVGMVLASLHAGGHLVLLSPTDFLKDPLVWLRAASRFRGVHTAAPNFAFDLAVRKCPPERLKAEAIDLSSLDNVGMGGEPVSWATVERFRAHFAPFGFRGEVLNPCYGLAENTLVATGHRRGEPLRALTLSLAGLQRHEVRPPAGDADRATLVGNGRAFPGMEVRIAGAEGEDKGERAVGEVWVRSPSLAAGYFGDRAATEATFVERDGARWLRTGDLGLLDGGDLFICGREKDLMIVRGRNFHPQDLEQEAGRVDGVRTGNAVAFAVERDGQEAAVVVAEVDPRATRAPEDVRREVVEAISAAFQLALAEVLLLPPGSIPKTSSGKLQRGLVKEAYLRGDLATFAPPGRVATRLLELRLGLGALRRRLGRRAAASPTAPAADDAGGDLDPRFAEALRRVRPDVNAPLTPGLRIDGLGLDSLERVELWLQLARLFDARVPDEAWSSSQTLGELQALLERHQGTGAAEGPADDGSSLLVRDLLAPPADPLPPFRPPPTAPLTFGLLTALTRGLWGWRVEGQEHLALDDGFVIAGNHATYFDGAWLHNAVPPAVRPRLTAFSWAGLPGFTRAFLAQMRTIPIDPEGSFRQAIRAGLAALAARQVVLIFPEGARTHSGRMTPFRPGVGLISLLSGRPIVPFRSRGMFEVYPRDRALPRFVRRRGQPPVEVRFGPPLVPPPLEPERAWSQAQALVRELRAAVEAL
ncbi:MAG: AMP-binding protein [Planctomycetes bacterium]|nr:AMP-binding protein [Planctomycetota bacterium]